MKKIFKDYDWLAIQQFYDCGHTVKEIDVKFGCCYATRRKARDLGLFSIRDKSRQQLNGGFNEISEERLNKIAQLYLDGNSWRELTALGVSETEYHFVRKMGLVKSRTSSEASKLRIQKHGPNKMGPEAKLRQSKRMSENNPGGRCKWYEVAGKKVQGRWERDFALLLEEHSIQWERCYPWPYVIDGKSKNYTPDFYLPERNQYIEIKGYWWGNDREKMDYILIQYPEKDIVIIEDYDSIVNYK